MVSRAERLFTPEEYLLLDRRSPVKSEYAAGKIYAMAGASLEHNIIAGNLIGEFYSQMRGRPCGTCPGDMRVHVPATGLYTYPDVTVICGEPRCTDDHGDVLLNPTVIVEVLSPSTEAFDRGDKAGQYRQISSLMDLLLVSQDRCRVEHYTRQGEDRWLLTEATEPEGAVVLSSIGCSLRLRDVYDRVLF